MCCLFGAYNYSGKAVKGFAELTKSLAKQATVRGTDATGIAYITDNRLVVNKEPLSAYEMKIKHPDNVCAVMGHTRHATQGNKKNNYNNHPFYGKCKNVSFALAHNGILYNDTTLKRKYNLPPTKVQTDSYVAVQLLKYKNVINNKSIKFMAEEVEGSYSFTVLDSNNKLWLIKGDSPLSIVHLPDKKLYIYASTSEILYKALVDTEYFECIKNGRFEEILINEGDILSITPDGKLKYDKFEYICTYGRNWWNYGMYSSVATNEYIDDLKSIASFHGYCPDDIDELLSSGFTLDEVEEYLYYGGEI